MAYSITAHYAGQRLLDGFSFFTGHDPNNGFVNYQSKEDALAKGLVSINTDYNAVKLGVDSNNTYLTSDKGRPSVRLTSNDAFTHGLFIADFYHMPASTCGTWPAFWAFNNQDGGASWPEGGELEIIEGANTARKNLFSAHTSAGCQAPSDGFSGEQGPTDCSPGPNNIGCNYKPPASDTTSYGNAFNAEGGGVYALEWDSEALKLWHFSRSTIPDNIAYAPTVGPDPSTWGPPQAIFGGSGCDPDTYFFNMSLVLNINFCGDYAGNVWGKADQCNQLAPTCKEFVAGNPGSFSGAYWDVGYIDVYQRRASTDAKTATVLPNATALRVPSQISNATVTISSIIPTHTRTVTITRATPSGRPSGAEGMPAGPTTINHHTLLGCFETAADDQAFSQVASSPDMDGQDCIKACLDYDSGFEYAGLHGNRCTCANNLGNATAVDNARCATPCPGNARETCGGGGNSAGPPNATTSTFPRNSRRATEPDAILLTVYGDLTNEPAPPDAPAMGGLAMHVPAKSAVTTTTAVTLTYTTVCATNPATLVEVEYCTTVTYEDLGCTSAPSLTYPATAPGNTAAAPSALAAIPMTTYAQTCRACGPHGESTVTLTVPAAVLTPTPTEEVVTALAVQTVIPIRNDTITDTNGNPNSVAAPAIGTMAARPQPGPPSLNPIPNHGSSGIENIMPVVASAPSGKTVAAMEWLCWGLTLWFGLFGMMLVL